MLRQAVLGVVAVSLLWIAPPVGAKSLPTPLDEQNVVATQTEPQPVKVQRESEGPAWGGRKPSRLDERRSIRSPYRHDPYDDRYLAPLSLP